MYKIKNQLIKFFVISLFILVPYVGVDASAVSDHSSLNLNDKAADLIAIRVRPGAEIKASPIRAGERRDARRDRMDDEQENYEEQYSEETDEDFSEPIQRQNIDRGRPGGIR